MAVGLFILYSGINAAKETINPLLGRPPEKEFVDKIQKIVMSFDDIIGIHDLLVHDYGLGRIMISLHAEVPADGDILKLHDTIDNAEHKLNQELNCSSVIHMDPVCNKDEETLKMKENVKSIIEDINKCLSLHDFRIVKGNTHTNIIFDLLVPYKFEISDNDLKQIISKKVSDIDEKYRTVIEIDKDFCNEKIKKGW